MININYITDYEIQLRIDKYEYTYIVEKYQSSTFKKIACKSAWKALAWLKQYKPSFNKYEIKY